MASVVSQGEPEFLRSLNVEECCNRLLVGFMFCSILLIHLCYSANKQAIALGPA